MCTLDRKLSDRTRLLHLAKDEDQVVVDKQITGGNMRSKTLPSLAEVLADNYGSDKPDLRIKDRSPAMTTTLRYKLLWITTCLLAVSLGTIPAAAQEPLLGLDLANYLANLDQWPMFGQNQMNTAISLNPSLSPRQ